jgi:TRAP-type mannitol/chloroaromatic compound transport system permease large subunit
VLVSAYNLSGGRDFVSDFILGLDFAPLATIAVMMLAFLILGTFMDWIGIVFLTMPIFVPIIEDMGYDPVWFGILFAINMQVAFLSPPFGPAAFYLKSVAPKSITLPMIYHSLWPFMLIQMVVLGLVMLYPQLTLWLPSL